MPEGSVEVPSQAWFFVNYLKQEFEKALPQTRYGLSYQATWNIKLDTNLRLKQKDEKNTGVQNNLKEFEEIRAFLETNQSVGEYRNSPDRLNSIAIEVRKDLVWQFHKGIPVGPKQEQAKTIADSLADGITDYFSKYLSNTSDD